jgi:hypothetical protein
MSTNVPRDLSHEDHSTRSTSEQLGWERNDRGRRRNLTSDFGTRQMDDPSEVIGRNNPDSAEMRDQEGQHIFEVEDHLNDGRTTPGFAGSSTNFNIEKDPIKDDIKRYGLDHMDNHGDFSKVDESVISMGSSMVPISPLHPFTRANPEDVRRANIITYNRFKLPVADLEHRKAFRHIFFGRPECYIMCDDGGPAEHTVFDKDFSSALSRMPHILSLLSPTYITGGRIDISNVGEQILSGCNWNYLLSNRVQGLSTSGFELSVEESTIKTPGGFTISPGRLMDSRQGSSINLSFKDTKYLEVFECLRLWMLYIHKRNRGFFAPPYEGYTYLNQRKTRLSGATCIGKGEAATRHHMYDRAIEYCAPLYDIVTNESMTHILYWCKYYGVYPTQVTPSGLSNSNNEALHAQMDVEATFKYHFKLENDNTSLVEFNYNSGIVDCMGALKPEYILNPSSPFLVRGEEIKERSDDPVDEYDSRSSTFRNSIELSAANMYMGAAGMFTGTPYIIMAQSPQNNPIGGGKLVIPQLRFVPLRDSRLDDTLNRGLVDSMVNTHNEQPIQIR